ncbi:membrane-bound lytic murein transglycosylase MltF [Marinobacter zhanjiangensis]|uniref:Membrane-bound lytic murein transglycosylase F n=1 Tax=Marinobacter zhanjiangensis TaxID=578215 RepID=A0ABQ3AZ82_9GAMM|nr:membrane-bound lytic murein transglycosylase MltF [Marinobacter zhanjiangensis]GGY71304.1 membrane-bound lytic murein transglycosylase F [Marinobacter zhanjiangensis]
MGAPRHSGDYSPFPARLLALAAVLCTLAISGCSRPDILATVKAEGVLHVVSRNAPSIYFKDREGATGFDYELAQRFADHLGVELRVRLMEGNSEILEVLDRGHAHIGFTGLSLTHDWEGRFRTLGNGLSSGSVVIYHRGLEGRFDSMESLAQQDITVHAAAETNHLPHLEQLQKELPQLTYRLHDGLDTAGILERVESGELRAAVVDANELALNHVFYPNVKRAFTVSDQESIAWLFPGSNDGSLYREAQSFFAKIREDGTLAHLRERFYGHLDQLGYVGSLTFEQHIRDRLPQYRDVFQAYGEETGIDWRLLAAIGYQESNWRRDAVSPTGVRGLMMLTRNTAKHIGIENRLNPTQSIKGGARYFRQVHGMIPDHVNEPDRTWFALASYNVGFGHLEDARRLTESAGRNPDRWLDVKEFLPRLSQKEWYSKTRHGYARGHEPVLYVQNIRRYYDVLARRFDMITESEPTMIARSENGGLLLPGELLDYRVNREQRGGEQETTLVLPQQMGITPPTL